MTTPNVLELRQRLGPNFNYTALARMLKSGVKLPDDMRDTMAELIAIDFDQRRMGLAPRDATEITGAPMVPGGSEGLTHLMRGLAMLGRGAVGAVSLVPGAKQVMDVTAGASQAMTGNPIAGQMLGEARQTAQQIGQQFGHDLFLGIPQAPQFANPEDAQAWNTVIKPMTMIGAMAVQGYGAVRLLGYATKLPRVGALMENLPMRLKEVGIGVVAAGVPEALRSDTDTTQASSFDLPAQLAKPLIAMGMNERAALGVGGMATGGAFYGAISSVMRGLQFARAGYIRRTVTDEQMATIKDLFKTQGLNIENISDEEVIRLFSSMEKMVLKENLAGTIGDLHSREQWVINELFDAEDLTPDSVEAKLLVGIFRNNPGGMNLVRNVADVDAVDRISQKLGLNVIATKIAREGGVSDVVLARPNYVYEEGAKVGRKTQQVTKVLTRMAGNKDIPRITEREMLILADGTPIRAGFGEEEILRRVKLQAPKVDGKERPDLALKVTGMVTRMELTDKSKILIELPNKMTNESFSAVGRMLDATKFDEVTLVAMDGTRKVLHTPFGQQVQDAIAGIVKPRSQLNPITPEMVKQITRQGVFNGQAALLPDGTPAIIRKKAGFNYVVEDPLLPGKLINVSGKKLTVLPTSLEGEMAPAHMFLDYLGPSDRSALAKLREGISKGLATEIKTFRDLEGFANSRGLFARNLKGGKVELTDANTGEVLPIFDNKKAAAEYVRAKDAPMAELTPTDISKYLGGKMNLGFIGGGGPPPQFGELMPINWARHKKTMEELDTERGPGVFDLLGKPMIRVMSDYDNRFGTQFSQVFNNLQSQNVARTNYIAKWYGGKGADLPKGVLPLRQIEKMAGDDADWELITEWLEIPKGTPDEAAKLAEMTPGMRKAAPELRKWYNAMFEDLGVEANFIEDYVPHWREHAGKHGSNPHTIWQATGGDPLNPPKGASFYADQYREGTLDVYDLHALRTAVKYLEQGASNRFMKKAFDDAKRMVLDVAGKNNRLALPLGQAVLSMKGIEFPAHKAAVQETMQSMIEHLPGSAPAKLEAAISNQLADIALGLTYTGALGARPGLALRNLFSTMVMAWPIYGGVKGDFLEGVARAMTKPGLEEAIAARAVPLKRVSVQALEEVGVTVPGQLQTLFNTSMYLYDSADELSRSITYHAAKIRAEKASAKFAQVAKNASKEKVQDLKKGLLEDSGLFIQTKQVQDEFFRLLGNDPDRAFQFAGKVASDVTMFLYGRGMQPRWMRGVSGRLFGQFGTWPLWYVDYLRRLTGDAVKGGFKSAAAAALARHAIVNAAVVLAGREVLDIDLSKWASYNAVFYSGGPAFSLVWGAAQLNRGISATVSGGEDPFSTKRMQEGLNTIYQTLPIAVPLYFAGRDVNNLLHASTPTERLAAILSTRPTREWTLAHRMQMLLDPQVPFSSSSPHLEDILNNPQGALDLRQIGPQMQQGPTQQSPPQSPVGQNTGQSPAPALQPLRTTVPPTIAYPKGTETAASGEAKPISQW